MQANSQSQSMLVECFKLFQSGDVAGAFRRANEAKSLHAPVKGLDYLRAICFAKMNRPGDARESLLEELRHFPDNQDASWLLEQIRAQFPENVGAAGKDPDFLEIYATIRPYTMMPEPRLYNLFRLAKMACDKDIPGNFAECGVAGGGSSAMLAWVIRRHSRRERLHYAFDSFEGMPAPTGEDTHQGTPAEATGWGTGTCAAPMDSVNEICAKLGVSDLVKPVKGYFQDTLPVTKAEMGPLALLHMDGDWYESTKSILVNLYAQVMIRGLIQIDDYGHWDGCRKALHEFEVAQGLEFKLNPIDGEGVWMEKAPIR